MELKEEERIDDLQYKGLKIIQNTKGFCFGIDAVLLSHFASNIKRNATVIDLCTGTGIVAILLEAKVELKKIYAVEIQEDMAEMAKRSVVLNHQQDTIEVLAMDLNKLGDAIPKATIDAITVNPPYKKRGNGIVNEKDTKSISRHEIRCTFEDILKVSYDALKPGGSLYVVHRTERLVDVLSSMRDKKVEPKRIQMIHPSSNKAPNLFLVEGVKNAKPFLTVEKPIYVYDEEGNYTQTIQQIYHVNDESEE